MSKNNSDSNKTTTDTEHSTASKMENQEWHCAMSDIVCLCALVWCVCLLLCVECLLIIINIEFNVFHQMAFIFLSFFLLARTHTLSLSPSLSNGTLPFHSWEMCGRAHTSHFYCHNRNFNNSTQQNISHFYYCRLYSMQTLHISKFCACHREKNTCVYRNEKAKCSFDFIPYRVVLPTPLPNITVCWALNLIFFVVTFHFIDNQAHWQSCYYIICSFSITQFTQHNFFSSLNQNRYTQSTTRHLYLYSICIYDIRQCVFYIQTQNSSMRV